MLPDFRAHECSHRCEGGSEQRPRMARAASGASAANVCAGTFSMRSRPRPSRPAFARIEDFNRGDNAGVSYFDVNQRGGLRVSSAKAFLKPRTLARQSHGVDAHARRATAVRARAERAHCAARARRCSATAKRVNVRATREVILSAGAIGTPQLLQLSGIGPASLLREHGIEVLHELSRRGREPAGSPADPPGVQGAAACAR